MFTKVSRLYEPFKVGSDKNFYGHVPLCAAEPLTLKLLKLVFKLFLDRLKLIPSLRAVLLLLSSIPDLLYYRRNQVAFDIWFSCFVHSSIEF